MRSWANVRNTTKGRHKSVYAGRGIITLELQESRTQGVHPRVMQQHGHTPRPGNHRVGRVAHLPRGLERLCKPADSSQCCCKTQSSNCCPHPASISPMLARVVNRWEAQQFLHPARASFTSSTQAQEAIHSGPALCALCSLAPPTHGKCIHAR